VPPVAGTQFEVHGTVAESGTNVIRFTVRIGCCVKEPLCKHFPLRPAVVFVEHFLRLKTESISGVENRRSSGSLPVAFEALLSQSAPQSGLAWLCFLFSLIEPDRRISRIRLSEKVSRFRPRKAACPSSKFDKAQHLMQGSD